ncbi:hypothetical protein Slin15195_G046810 [Septoria linicola]|uniref:Ca3427-like PBP 2 domain-containing protein n=1 Tax=Septoria linicola TaxID=215465 RepID=A0A9Q9EIS6_9PEZI|nr:hypothetical protein Slin14017_G050330 [Septoria linicola]USW51362.1 hypothetical protein Slin15195_G046810 [Septoria linicola]
MTASKLRIGYVPEHFSTPLAFAAHKYSFHAELIPFPTGTGALAASLKAPREEKSSIDVAIGLTEGFVADLGKANAAGEHAGYGFVGTYVESPLCWAISTGAKRSDVNSVADLKGKNVGVSRIGSGSYVMSFVLADQEGWLQQTKEPFGVVPIGDFAALRKSVGQDKSSDFFMWEHFTTKHYWDNGELKRIGEIYTPWPSWMIVARTHENIEAEVEDMMQRINDGVQYYRENKAEAIDHITTNMEYSKEDALEWMKTVRFPEDVRGVSASTVDQTAAILRKAGVLTDEAGGSEHMIIVGRAGPDVIGNPAEV